MKCNPWRWLWGIPLLAMWYWITFASERPPIEMDLTQRTQIALNQAGHDWARTSFDGRDGILHGRATSLGDREKAASVVRDTWGVRILKDETALLAAVDRYVWSAEYNSNAVELTGFIPSEQTRASVLKAVKGRFPKAAIQDNLKLARGGIEVKPWLKGISFGLDQLSGLERGKLDFVNMDYSLIGRAPSYAVYKDVRTALSNNTPTGVRLAKQDVSPPTVSPYTWNAKRTATQIVFSGHVPSENARLQLFEKAKKRFPNLAVIDRMETAAGAVPGWSRTTGVLLDQLAELETGEANMTDKALTLVGHAPSKDIADKIKSVADEDVPDAFELKAALTYPVPKPPKITPFVTSIDATSSRIRLYGYVPNDDERAKLMEAARAKFPSHEIIDNLRLGSGEPQSWRACLFAGLTGIEKLGAGTVRLEDQKVSVAGETTDETIAEHLAGDVRAAANRACTSAVDVKLNLPPEPQLNWSANYDGDGEVVLDGEVPDVETRSALLTAAAKNFPDAKVVDQMTVVPGYAKKWRGVAQIGMNLLGKLRKGRATISGQELTITGEAKDTAVASAVKGHLKTSIVRGYTGREQLIVRSSAMIWAEEEARRKAAAKTAAFEAERLKAESDAKRLEAERLAAIEAARLEAQKEEARREADKQLRAKAEQEARSKAEEAAKEARELAARQAALKAQQDAQRERERDKCTQAMRSITRTGVIRFKFASSDLDAKSHSTLNKISEQAGACPDFKVRVSGHTDSVGALHRNMALSQRRAQSVVDYLARQGVPRSRMEAEGFGETKPVAPNDSRSGRAKNRRIEFEVQ